MFITTLAVSIIETLLVTAFNYEKKTKLARKAQEGYAEQPKPKITLKSALEKTALPGSLSHSFFLKCQHTLQYHLSLHLAL